MRTARIAIFFLVNSLVGKIARGQETVFGTKLSMDFDSCEDGYRLGQTTYGGEPGPGKFFAEVSCDRAEVGVSLEVKETTHWSEGCGVYGLINKELTGKKCEAIVTVSVADKEPKCTRTAEGDLDCPYMIMNLTPGEAAAVRGLNCGAKSIMHIKKGETTATFDTNIVTSSLNQNLKFVVNDNCDGMKFTEGLRLGGSTTSPAGAIDNEFYGPKGVVWSSIIASSPVKFSLGPVEFLLLRTSGLGFEAVREGFMDLSEADSQQTHQISVQEVTNVNLKVKMPQGSCYTEHESRWESRTKVVVEGTGVTKGDGTVKCILELTTDCHGVGESSEPCTGDWDVTITLGTALSDDTGIDPSIKDGDYVPVVTTTTTPKLEGPGAGVGSTSDSDREGEGGGDSDAAVRVSSPMMGAIMVAFGLLLM